VDEAAGTVTHDVQGSSSPDLQGRHHVRWVEFQGENRMVLVPCEDGKGGSVARQNATYRLYWERMR